MIPIFLLIAFALPNSAVEIGQSSSNEPTEASVGPITRWIGFYKRIYNDSTESKRIKFDELKMIVKEMSQIEQTDAYRLGLKPLIESGAYKFDRYSHLVDRALATNVLVEKDASITNLLEQTFDYSANDCTAEYLGQLDDLYETFRQAPIAEALKENRGLQLSDCWNRYMSTLSAVFSSLDARVRNQLKQIEANVNLDTSVSMIHLSTNLNSSEYHKESEQIADGILKFLRDIADGKREATSAFDSNVKLPCLTLIDSARQMMQKIFYIIEFLDDESRLMLDGQQLVINSFVICDRIIADERFIKLAATRSLEESGRDKMAAGPNISNIPDLNEESVELITQHLSVDQDQEELEQIAPLESAEQTFSDQEPYVVRVDQVEGRGRSTKYPTIWSDGRRTLETKTYLFDNWPVQLDVSIRGFEAERQKEIKRRQLAANSKSLLDSLRNEQNHVGRARSKKPRRARKILEPIQVANIGSDKNTTSQTVLKELAECRSKSLQPNILESYESGLLDKDKCYDWISGQLSQSVVRVDRAIRRGPGAEYPTTWSDGTTTMETRSFLQKFWPMQLKLMVRRLNKEKQARFAGKRMTTAISNFKSSKRGRKLADMIETGFGNLVLPQLDQVPVPMGTSEQGENSPRVVRVRDSTGRGRNTKYVAEWSDGRITKESRAFMLLNWPVELDVLLRKKGVEKHERWVQHKSAEKYPHFERPAKRRRISSLITSEFAFDDPESPHADDEDENSSEHIDISSKIVRIEPGDGRGRNTRYTAIWSDGRTTMENKQYLSTRWLEAWDNFVREHNAERRADYATRLAEPDFRPGFTRPRIPFLARQQQKPSDVNADSSNQAYDLQDNPATTRLNLTQEMSTQAQSLLHSDSGPASESEAAHTIQQTDAHLSTVKDDVNKA